MHIHHTQGYIASKLIAEFLEHQERKSKDYNSLDGFEPHRVLGLRGQFADIWRKIWKLYKAFWMEEKLEGEQPRHILMDLIGHCFLSIAVLDEQELEDKRRRAEERVLCAGCGIIWLRVGDNQERCRQCRLNVARIDRDA